MNYIQGDITITENGNLTGMVKGTVPSLKVSTSKSMDSL